MKTTIYNKLVRDKIPEIIALDGEVPVVRRLSSTEYKEELFRKLVEEAKEVVGASADRKNLIVELADLLEVISSIMETIKIPMKTVSSIRRKRSKERGVFSGKIFLKSISKK